MKLKILFVVCIVCLVFIQNINGQEQQKFLYTKGDNNISTITMGAVRSAQCTVIEYSEFLVVLEIPNIPINKMNQDSLPVEENKANPLISFIDSIYLHKPIKYVLNSHYHSHSLSSAMPFLDKGATLITAKENIEIYNKRGLFDNQTNTNYSESIIAISADTVLLAETKNPIAVLYLKKSDYKSIPTETFLFFHFPTQKLLAASCMVYLYDFNEKYGYKGVVYSDRLIDVNKIITDKNLKVENTIQLFRLRIENEIRKPPVFPISYFKDVLNHGWHRLALSEHFQNMSYEKLTTKKDSLLNFLVENDIYHIVLNHATYSLIEKKEYQKAVAIAQLLVIYEPGDLNEIDTLGEAYFNNGQIASARHYDSLLKNSKLDADGLGMIEWEKNQKNRLKNDS